MSKNILFVIGSFYPAQLGGPSTTIYMLAKTLVSKGHNVTVLALNDGLDKKLIKKHGLKINEFNSLDGINVCYYSYKFRPFSLGLIKYMIKNIKKYDIVHLTSLFFPLSILSAFICIKFNIDFSIAPRGELFDGAILHKGKKKKYIFKYVLRKLYSQASFFISTSEYEKKLIKEYFTSDSKIKILPNFMDFKQIDISDKDIEQKKDILFLGRIHPIKQIELIIEALNILINKKDVKLNLNIAGLVSDKKYKLYLEKLISKYSLNKYVNFLGHLQGKEKEGVLLKSKILILPSKSENFGNVVVEGLYFGNIIIASKGTPWSILGESECGYWIDDKISEIVDVIKLIENLNKNESTKFARNAIHLAKVKFSLKNNIEVIDNILAE